MPPVTTTTTTATPDDGSAASAAASAAAGADVLATKWPRTAADVSTEWLCALLGASVASFELKVLGAGVLSDAAIVYPTYEGAQGRKSVVIKYPKFLEYARQVATSTGAYKKECAFYEGLAAKMPIKTPEILGVWRDSKAPDEWFCIAMEDLSVDNDVCSVIQGIDYPTAENLARTAARMHARFFESDELKAEYLNGLGPDGLFTHFFAAWAMGFFADPAKVVATNSEVIKTCPPPRVTSRTWFCKDYYPEVAETIEIFSGPDGLAIMTEMKKRLTDRPFTVVHGDLRCDNLFKPKGDGDELTLIDWQMVCAGPPAVDLVQCYIMTMGDLKDATKIFDLVKTWHDEFARLNPDAGKKYPFATAKEDFQLSAAISVLGMAGCFAGFCSGMKDTPESPVWDLQNAMMPRMGEVYTHASVLEITKRVAAELKA